MKYFKKIEGEKVYLSPINVDDYELYVKWLNNPKMCMFLKPHILFGDKFERYLNEDVVLPKRTLKEISYAEFDAAIEAEKRKNESN